MSRSKSDYEAQKALLQKQIDQAKAKLQDVKAREKEAARKARTHRLIVGGGAIEAVIGTDLEGSELETVKRQLKFARELEERTGILLDDSSINWVVNTLRTANHQGPESAGADPFGDEDVFPYEGDDENEDSGEEVPGGFSS